MVYVTHDQEEALSIADQVVVLAASRVIQADPPAVIYQRPATAFVARFIGGSNLLHAQIDDANAAGLRVRPAAADGPFLVLPLDTWAGSTPPVPGQAVLLACKPDHLRVDPTGTLYGIVTQTTFLGAHWRIGVRTAWGELSATVGATSDLPLAWALDTPVGLQLNLDQVRVFPAETSVTQ
jgi:ABC-type Fe3+/spermidine/putrescine transport system ATPase subunit